MKTEVESLKELVQLLIAKVEFFEAENAALRVKVSDLDETGFRIAGKTQWFTIIGDRISNSKMSGMPCVTAIT